jgi:hypothetical protein
MCQICSQDALLSYEELEGVLEGIDAFSAQALGHLTAIVFAPLPQVCILGLSIQALLTISK